MKQLLLLLATLGCGSLSAQNLVINELMQSNVENIMDDIKEFPDSWVELYNPTDAAINLKDYKISNGQLHRLRRNQHVSTYTLNRLCSILDCRLSDIAEYIRDEEILP